MRRFGAPWDRQLLTSTIALLAVIAVTAIAGTAGALQANLRGVALAVTLFSSGVAIGAWALAPRGYAIGEGRLRILRNGWRPVEVRLDEIRAVSLLDPDALRGSLKLFGMGGLFGYYGIFRSPSLGSYRLHATRGAGLVLVRTSAHTHVLTPEPPDDFAEALLAAAPRARRERLRRGP
jgi:membrane protease YdiL (CAAX protease family)